MTKNKSRRNKLPEGANRMPADSMFYDRLVPIILVSLGVITAGLILIALLILFGVI